MGASKAVSKPLSLDFEIVQLRIDGVDFDHRCDECDDFCRSPMRRHLPFADATNRVDGLKLPWMNTNLLTLVRDTISQWPWECSHKTGDGGLRDSEDFETALLNAMTDFEARVPGKWEISLRT